MNEIYIESMIAGKVEFPTYFALHYLFAIKVQGPVFGQIVYHPAWTYFIDGYEEKHGFNLN